MNQLGEPSRIPLLNIEEGDVGILLGIPIAALFAAAFTGVESLTLPAMAGGLAAGIVTVYVAPTHVSASHWLTAIWTYAKQPQELYHVPDDDDTTQRNDGGLLNYTPFGPDTRAQSCTALDRTHPEYDAVERDDGSMEAFLTLTPGNMDFGMATDWARIHETAETFANSELTFDCKLYTTTQSFPVETLTGQLDTTTKPDDDADPVFEALREEYRQKRPQEMQQRGTQEIHFYLGVSVSPLEVYDRSDVEPTPLEKLTHMPVVGFLFNPFVSRRADFDAEERREKMADLLDRRLQSLQSEFIEQVSGWSARRVDAEHLLDLERAFWNGTDPGDTTTTDAKDIVAPKHIAWNTRSAKLGDEWTTTFHITDYPDYPTDGYLSGLFELTDVEFDCTVHLSPKQQDRARKELEETAEDLQVDADLERSIRGSYLQERVQEATATYKAVEAGQRVFAQHITLTVRAPTKSKLKEAATTVRRTLQDTPANLTPKPAICTQQQALEHTAPIGTPTLDRNAIALGGAVGAVLASPHSPTILEEGGVEVGRHKDTKSPVVIDPFARENGYAMFTVGDPGSGKSFGAKQQFLRTLEQDPDRIGVVLEPLNNWAGVADALDATRITVGGTRGLNPLDIQPTPEHVQRAMGADASPFAEKLDDVMSFLTNYFALRGVALDDRRTTLETAIVRAYNAKGITDDIATHHKESPTLQDILDVLEAMVETPTEYITRSEAEAPKIEADATWLLDQLAPFDEDGRFSNLGSETDFTLQDEDIIYLDLAQQEGSTGGHTSLLMQLLISLVYEKAKESDQEVVLYIDEARYLMTDAANLSFLETVFRHHRHHNLSIRLVTQTVDEFFEHPESEAILDQCAIKQFHRLDGMDETWADEFGLNHAQMRFVQDAVPGSEDTGYSEALVGVDGEWRGIRIHALPKETDVIDFDPRSESSRTFTSPVGHSGSKTEQVTVDGGHMSTTEETGDVRDRSTPEKS